MSQIVLLPGDNRISLAALPENCVDSVVCDPPYGLVSIEKRFGKKGAAAARTDGNDGSFARLSGGFMGARWDSTGIERDPEFWKLVYRVLRPGGYVFAFSGSRTGHWQAVAMETAGFIMHPMHGWVFGCMDPETECLTRRGWLRYTDLLPFDEVCQWNSETDTLSWVMPERVHEYDFDGEMVQIKNRHAHQVLTPNHRVYAKVRRHSRHPKPTDFEVVEALDIHNRPGNWQVDLPMAAELGGAVEIEPSYAYLVGWWLTDAWPHRDTNACCFSQSKPATLIKLRTALEGLGASEYVKAAKQDTHRDEHTFYLTGSMADRLRAEFPARDLNWDVLGWTIEARRALYEGLMDGDGSRNKPGQIAEAFWSQRQARRDVFLALALSIGIRCYEDAAKGVVYVNPKTRTTQVQGKQRADRLPYRGKVWCLTVPTGAFVVRRSGRPFITGNSGFPKAHAADKAIDKHFGVKGEIVPAGNPVKRMIPGADPHREGSWIKDDGREYQPGSYVPATDEAAQWQGWAYGTQAQKPALEPIYLGQKPFDCKTGAENLLKHGVGAVNIDGCRVPTDEVITNHSRGAESAVSKGKYGDSKAQETHQTSGQSLGRHPANLILDGSPNVVALFPESKGQIARSSSSETRRTQNVYGDMARGAGTDGKEPRGDEGSAARFFHQFPLTDEDYAWAIEFGLIGDTSDIPPLIYNAKAGKVDRAGSKHPTVKPIALMENLIRHITPKGGIVLDPFAGSGTTAAAASRGNFDCILLEAEKEYVEFIHARFALPDTAPAITVDQDGRTMIGKYTYDDFDLSDLLGEPATLLNSEGGSPAADRPTMQSGWSDLQELLA